MKTSFYFVLWILIYPILGLLNNSFINENSFVIALALVGGLSWLLHRLMPEILTYEGISETAPIMEDIYSGNVTSFKKRLSREAWIETVTAIYFCVTTVVIGIAIFKVGVNDWIALAVFALFTFGAISRSANLMKANSSLKSEPTPEQCMKIAEKTYKLDYAAYYEERQNSTYESMLPQCPRRYKVFQWFSIIIAAIASLLGLLHIILSLVIMLNNSDIETQAVACMCFLYGSLAAYFGIKDSTTILQYFKNKSKSSQTSEN